MLSGMLRISKRLTDCLKKDASDFKKRPIRDYLEY